ncbi:diguanylate cyclase domain-containing protein [Butyrivibrio sp. XPD2002]|uniref:diguanylate cyclase domain-containing protein n=1 Tax=Butyrivibrio sp. XPD2002 TaxID=1280665 RepID=UPI00041EB16F|nr:GGDEF domain-containing protein [Butyrivibrio sp. XPD2002]
MINGKKLVALCTYRIYESQVFGFVTELNRLLQANDCYLFIYTLNSEIGNSGDESDETAVFDLVPYDKVDAVVIMDEKIKSREVVQKILDKAASHDVPAIVIDGEYENASLVRFNYAKGFEAVVRHVIEFHKVKRPHFMAGKRNSPFSNERIEVFKKVIEENGFTFDDSMVSYGDFWATPSRKATLELLQRPLLPDAIICANDIMAINVCDVLQIKGIRVPDEVIVTGFDGVEEAFWSKPGITTAKCDSIELAVTIMDVLLSVFKGQRNIDKWIDPSFIENDSCGCHHSELDLLEAVSGLNNRFYHHQDDIHVMQAITAKILTGKSSEESIKYIRNPLTAYMCIVIEKSCLDLENNFIFENIEKGEKVVIYDWYSGEDTVTDFNTDEIIPHLNDVLDKGYPLIFNCLEYMGKAPGFICYSYPRAEFVDYSLMPSLTYYLGMAFGGYVINKYQKYLRDKLQRTYQYDALTGLYNRLAFLEKFEEVHSNPENLGKKVTLVMLDLNGLKQINDSFGHLAGDNAIATIARILKEECPEDALCVRVGGDEMLALILGECDWDSMEAAMIGKMEEATKKLGYTVSASMGIATTVMDDDINLDRIIALADEEMYKMKRNKWK